VAARDDAVREGSIEAGFKEDFLTRFGLVAARFDNSRGD